MTVFPIFLWLFGCDSLTFRTTFDDVEDAILYEASKLVDAPDPEEQLVVLNYNIKYGGGRLLFFWECEGERYNMTEQEVTGQLDDVAQFIRYIDPDILILQEVDRQSQRSVYIDQTQYVLDNTDLNYGVYASQHKGDFIPSDGMGRMDFGNAILAKWPMSDAKRFALPLMSDKPAYYNYFYLKRHILHAKVAVPGVTDLYVVNTHLEAFSDDGTRQKQLTQLHEHLRGLSQEGFTWIAGGDLNSVPKGTEQVADFVDDCPGLFDPDDYTGEDDWLDPLFTDFHSAMPLDDYQQNNSKWFSYTGKAEVGWTRTLDYIFSDTEWFEPDENYIIQSEIQGGYETLPLSDHAPFRAVWMAQ